MSFELEPVRTPESLGTIVVVLKDTFIAEDGGEPAPYQSAAFQVNVILDDGTTISRRGNLVPHITAAQRTGLMAFMESLRTQAEEQILGVVPE